MFFCSIWGIFPFFSISEKIYAHSLQDWALESVMSSRFTAWCCCMDNEWNPLCIYSMFVGVPETQISFLLLERSELWCRNVHHYLQKMIPGDVSVMLAIFVKSFSKVFIRAVCHYRCSARGSGRPLWMTQNKVFRVMLMWYSDAEVQTITI